MNLTGVRDGDLLLVESRGERFYVMAGERRPGAVRCRALSPERDVRDVRAYDVIGHWRASAVTRRSMEGLGNVNSTEGTMTVLERAAVKAIAGQDREFAATLYVLDFPTLHDRVLEFVDLRDRQIDFTAMLEQPWSDGERALIETACSLWGRHRIADGRVSGLLYEIDDEAFERVVTAMQIRRGGGDA